MKCLRAPLFPSRKRGHRDHLGFYPFFAKTSRYCLDGGKVELRVVMAGGQSLVQAAKPCRSLGEDPSVTLAVRDGKHPSEIPQEWGEIARHTSWAGHQHTWSWALLAQETSGTKRGTNLAAEPAAVTYQCCFHCRAQSDHCGPGQCRENDHSVPIVSRTCRGRLGGISRCVYVALGGFTGSSQGGSGWLQFGKGSAG